MKNMENTQAATGQRLKSELARFCLPEANRDSNRKLAWVNSIGIFFLLIGVVGANRDGISIQPPRPIEEAIPVVIEPLTPPPVRIEATQNQESSEKPGVPQIVAVVMPSPAINFSVPTIGNLIVPNALAVAPPANPLQPLAPVRNQATAINSTGTGGERPQPRYPKIAQDLGQQGTVVLSMTVDENGSITAIQVKESSGSPILDRNALDFVKRHWLLPSGAAGRIYEAPIRYVFNQ